MTTPRQSPPASSTPSHDNPLLAPDLPDSLPRFDRVRPDHVEPAVRSLVARALEDLAELERRAVPTWAETIEAVTTMTEPLYTAWGIVQHLMGVQNSPELRAAHDAVQKDVVQASMRIAQSEALYRALVALKSGAEWSRLDGAERRVVEAGIRDAELSGVGLSGEKKDRFEKVALELAELATKFTNNVLDATKAFSLVLTTPEEKEGLPPTLLAATAQGPNGPWKITLDAPVFIPFMEHSRRTDLREKVYRAQVTRASSG
jgi:oligopeptidase A